MRGGRDLTKGHKQMSKTYDPRKDQEEMRTSATFMLDGSKKGDACVSIGDDHSANIEFRDRARKHYIRIHGLSPATCRELAKSLGRAADELDEERPWMKT